MANVALSAFLPFILPQCKHCPDVTVEFNVLQACIELCKKSSIWREWLPTRNTQANTTFYAYAPATGQRVHKLLQVTLAGQEVQLVDAVKGRALDARQAYGPYAYGKPDGFELRPAQAAGLELLTLCAVHPTQAAEEVPDWLLENHGEDVAKGALYRLHGHVGRDYAQPNLVAFEKECWERAIAAITNKATRAHAATQPRIRPVWF